MFSSCLLSPLLCKIFVSPSFPPCSWNQSLLFFRTACWQTWKQHLNPHPEFWKRKKFSQICSHRSSEVGWMCTTGFWKMKLFGINERWPALIKAVLCLCHDMFTLLDAAQVGRIFAHHSYVGFFLCISVIMNFLTIIGSKLLFPFLLQVKPG